MSDDRLAASLEAMAHAIGAFGEAVAALAGEVAGLRAGMKAQREASSAMVQTMMARSSERQRAVMAAAAEVRRAQAERP